MTNPPQSEATAKRLRSGAKLRRPGSPAEGLVPRSMAGVRGASLASELDAGAGPVAVQVHIGERWIAGAALTDRRGPAGTEVLVSHHGHLIWVDQQEVRVS